jgi:hypothetical protein
MCLELSPAFSRIRVLSWFVHIRDRKKNGGSGNELDFIVCLPTVHKPSYQSMVVLSENVKSFNTLRLIPTQKSNGEISAGDSIYLVPTTFDYGQS